MELSDLIAHAPEEKLDAYITERQPKRGEAVEDGWMLDYQTSPARAEDRWVCLISYGERWVSQMEPPDYGWAVEEYGTTHREAMAKAIMAAHKEVW